MAPGGQSWRSFHFLLCATHCNCGGQGWRWLPYKHLTGHQTNYPCVYLVNKHGHFEPILDDVQEDVYSRTPYLKISDSLDCRYHHYVSQDVLDSSLVNPPSDEQKEGLRGYQSSTYLHQKIHG